MSSKPWFPEHPATSRRPRGRRAGCTSNCGKLHMNPRVTAIIPARGGSKGILARTFRESADEAWANAPSTHADAPPSSLTPHIAGASARKVGP
jgi:hypothetical protein